MKVFVLPANPSLIKMVDSILGELDNTIPISYQICLDVVDNNNSIRVCIQEIGCFGYCDCEKNWGQYCAVLDYSYSLETKRRILERALKEMLEESKYRIRYDGIEKRGVIGNIK